MESFVKTTNVEPRKEWVAPELKKIDVAQITASGVSGSNDHHAWSQLDCRSFFCSAVACDFASGIAFFRYC